MFLQTLLWFWELVSVALKGFIHLKQMPCWEGSVDEQQSLFHWREVTQQARAEWPGSLSEQTTLSRCWENFPTPDEGSLPESSTVLSCKNPFWESVVVSLRWIAFLLAIPSSSRWIFLWSYPFSFQDLASPALYAGGLHVHYVEDSCIFTLILLISKNMSMPVTDFFIKFAFLY